MEHAAGTTHLLDKGLPYADICELTETWYQGTKGVGKWPPSYCTHQGLQVTAFYLQPSCSPCPCQCFQKGQSTSKLCDKNNDTCNLHGEKGHWANECLNKAHFAAKALLRHHQAQPTLFGTFITSWTWKSISKPWTLPRRMRRTARNQAKMEKHSSNGHRVSQDC